MARTMKMPRKRKPKKGKKGKTSKTTETEKQVESMDPPQVTKEESDTEKPSAEDKKVDEAVTDSAGSEGTGEKSVKKDLSLQLKKVTGTKRLKKGSKPVEDVET